MLCFSKIGHPQFPEWRQSSQVPIHILFGSLCIYKYHRFVTTIYEYFYPMVYKSILGIEMPRLSE